MKTTFAETISHKRYCVGPGQVVRVAIERPDGDEQPASGELSDITVTGARILSQVPLRFGEKVVLHLESESADLSFTINCEVQWIRQGSADDEWIIACLFESRLEPDLLKEYVDSRRFERRESDRRETSLPATIQFEVTGEETEVLVSNIGTGGFRYVSRAEVTIGSRVRLTFDEVDAEQLEARIKWQSTNNGEYLIGCQWVNRMGRDFARQFVQVTESTQEKKGLRQQPGHIVRRLINAVRSLTGQ